MGLPWKFFHGALVPHVFLDIYIFRKSQDQKPNWKISPDFFFKKKSCSLHTETPCPKGILDTYDILVLVFLRVFVIVFVFSIFTMIFIIFSDIFRLSLTFYVASRIYDLDFSRGGDALKCLLSIKKLRDVQDLFF